MIFRDTNDDCLVCGSQLPSRVQLDTVGQRTTFFCPDCGATIAEGLVAERGEFQENPPFHVPRAHQISMGDETEWDRAEIWWSNRTEVGMIHGRKIFGSSDLKVAIEKLYDIYDRS